MIIHCKITISWFTAYRYLFAFLHDDINNNTSIDSYLFDFTYCVPRSFSLLSCIGFMLHSCYRWSRGVTILQLQVSIQQLSGVKRTISVHVVIILWTCTKTITYCAGLYCGYFVDFVQQTKADFAV